METTTISRGSPPLDGDAGRGIDELMSGRQG
jgi:hypothetical protein